MADEKDIIESGLKSWPVIGIPLSMFLGWIASSFRYGEKYGKFQNTVQQHGNDIASLELKLETIEGELKSEVKAMIEPISKAIEEIRGQFFTRDNEPRLLSYKAHDKIQQACQLHILSEFKHNVTAVERVEGELSEFKESFQESMRGIHDEIAKIKNKE